MRFNYRGATVYRLDAYGNILTAHGSDAYGADLATEADPYIGFGAQFGYYHDAETGLFYLQNRYYDPAFGRFLNRDPIGLDGGMNRYGLVSGDPVSGADPSGLDRLLWYDRLSNWVGGQAEGAKQYLFRNTPWYVGAPAATVVDLVAGIGHMPSTVGHLGEGFGAYAGNPTSANAIKAWGDVGTISSLALSGIGGSILRGSDTCEQYALVAKEDGFYPVMKRGFDEPQGGIYLKRGETWRYGETIHPKTRYSQKFLERTGKGLEFKSQFKGSKAQAVAKQNAKIANYRNRTGSLPPGNKIVN